MLRHEINRPSTWNGKALTGKWQVTLKVDGVRAIWHDDFGWQSRASKPLFNIPEWTGGPRDCELYVGSFRDTIISTRTKLLKSDTPTIRKDHLYGLDQLDDRLDRGTIINPKASDILHQLAYVRGRGFEGLVLRQGSRWLKVKPNETHDVPITSFVEGKGKHAGRLGIINTPLGDVGSGFSDKERVQLWAEAQTGTLVGQIIEVSLMEMTSTGKFRHPSFIRMRPDKLSM